MWIIIKYLRPDNRLNERKPVSVTIEAWKSWREMRNRLPNLHFPEGRKVMVAKMICAWLIITMI